MRITPETVKKIVAGDSKTLQDLLPIIRKCARAGCIRARAEFLAEEVQQELMILLFAKIAPKFDPDFHLEPILIESARRIALSESRKHSRGGIMFVQEDALADLYGSMGAGSSWSAQGISSEHGSNGDRSTDSGLSVEGNSDTHVLSEIQAEEANSQIDRRRLLSQLYGKHDGLRIQLLSILNGPIERGSTPLDTNKSSISHVEGPTPKDSDMNASIAPPSLKKAVPASSPPSTRARGRPRTNIQGAAASVRTEISLEKKNTWPSGVCVNNEVPSFPPVDISDASDSPVRASTSDGMHLKHVRETCGMTQYEMAVVLGLHPSTYLSYEYGRVKQVPTEVLRKANKLGESSSEESAFRNSKYAGLTMRDISGDWAKRLNVDPDRITEFANRIGVNKSTVSRWRNEGQRPSIREIVLYEKHVAQLEAMWEKSARPAEREESELVSAKSAVTSKKASEPKKSARK